MDKNRDLLNLLIQYFHVNVFWLLGFIFLWQCELCHRAMSCETIWRQILQFQLL